MMGADSRNDQEYWLTPRHLGSKTRYSVSGMEFSLTWLFFKLNIDFWYCIASCGFCPCSLFFMRRWKPDDTRGLLVLFFQLPGFGYLNYLGGLFYWLLFVTFSRASVDLLHAVPQHFHLKWTNAHRVKMVDNVINLLHCSYYQPWLSWAKTTANCLKWNFVSRLTRLTWNALCQKALDAFAIRGAWSTKMVNKEEGSKIYF